MSVMRQLLLFIDRYRNVQITNLHRQELCHWFYLKIIYHLWNYAPHALGAAGGLCTDIIVTIISIVCGAVGNRFKSTTVPYGSVPST